MTARWRHLDAEVEWHSGRRGFERPARLRLRGETLELTVERQWVEGPASAGGALTRWFVALDSRGRRFRIAVRAGAVVSAEAAEAD